MLLLTVAVTTDVHPARHDLPLDHPPALHDVGAATLDVGASSARRGRSDLRIETMRMRTRRLFRETDRQIAAQSPSESGPYVPCHGRFMDGSGSGWKRAHELTRLARARAGHDAEEARWLLEGCDCACTRGWGAGSFFEYLERTFGYGPRLAREKLRVAEAMGRLPALRDSLAEGSLSWSAVREISRVAVADTCEAWIDRARGRTLREIEDLVSGRRPGALPGDPAEPGLRRHVLRLEISGDAMAAFRDARRALEDEVGHSLEDDELVRMLAHSALGGGEERGRAVYQIAMTVCEACGAGSRDGAGRTFEIEPRDVEMARCDGQVLARTRVESKERVPRGDAVADTGESAEVDIDPDAASTPVGRGSSATPPRALQIPPRIRRAVWRRDHGRCAAPGCRASRFLEVHHIVARSEGGFHDPGNPLLLCSAHHGRVHDGTLPVRGVAPDRLVFVRQGAPATQRLSVAPSTAVDVIAGLRRAGFSSPEARAAVQVATAGGASDVEAVVRGALRALRGTGGSTVETPARAAVVAPG